MLRASSVPSTKKRTCPKKIKPKQQSHKSHQLTTLTNRSVHSITTPILWQSSPQHSTHNVRNNNNNKKKHKYVNQIPSSVPHTITTQKRTMAFSFDKPASYRDLKPVARAPMPWEKNDQQESKPLFSGPLTQPQLPHRQRAHHRPKTLSSVSFDSHDDETSYNEEDEVVDISIVNHNGNTSTNIHSTTTTTTTTTTINTNNNVQQPKPTISGLGNSKFSFSKNLHANYANVNDPNGNGGGQSKIAGRIVNSLAPQIDANKRADMTGIAINDLETMFKKHSTMSGVFSEQHQHQGQSFWALSSETPILHFVGTRRLINHNGNSSPPTFAFHRKSVNKPMRTIKHDFTTYSYETNGPVETSLMLQLEPDCTRGSMRQLDQDLPPHVSFRTVMRLRGVPWKWHAGVQMTHMSTDRSKIPLDDEGNPTIPVQPDVFTATRMKYTPTGYISEKIIRNGDTIVMTVIDEMSLVDRNYFDQRVKQVKDADQAQAEQQLLQQAKLAEEEEEEQQEQQTKKQKKPVYYQM